MSASEVSKSLIQDANAQKARKSEISIIGMLGMRMKKHIKISCLPYNCLILTKEMRFQCSDILGSPYRVYGKLVHEYSLLSVKTCNKHSQQMLRTFFFSFLFFFLQKEQRKSALSIRTFKGTLSFWCYVFASLHKYCYSTAPIQGPENSCVHAPP